MAKMVENFNSRMDAIGEKLKDRKIKVPIDLTAGIVSFLIAAVIMIIMPSQVAVADNDERQSISHSFDVGYAAL